MVNTNEKYYAEIFHHDKNAKTNCLKCDWKGIQSDLKASDVCLHRLFNIYDGENAKNDSVYMCMDCKLEVRKKYESEESIIYKLLMEKS